jgi:hypothetical protein
VIGLVQVIATNSCGVGCIDTPRAATRPGMSKGLSEELARTVGRSVAFLRQPLRYGLVASFGISSSNGVRVTTGRVGVSDLRRESIANSLTQFSRNSGFKPRDLATSSAETLGALANSTAAAR